MENKPKIAILGFGSLIWEKRPEFDNWHEDWQKDGPTLQIEFSRISKTTRMGALTLVIDPVHGTETRVAWCISKRKDPDDAFCDLRCREGTTIDNIGKMLISDGLPSEQPAWLRVIYNWAIGKGKDAVVWTDLKSNFEEIEKRRFSTENAIEYIQTRLTPEGKVKAAEYVWRAPDFVKTPLRNILQSEPWFPKPKDA